MLHRKRPWFDLANLYVRYYTPKSTTECTDAMKQVESSPSEALIGTSGSDENAAHNKANGKIKGFFTPKSSQAKSTQFN